MNGTCTSADPQALRVIREAYTELINEMSVLEIDQESIRTMLTPEEFEKA